MLGQYTASELLAYWHYDIPMLGWGPYVLEEWDVGSHIALSRNPNYFRAGEGLPKFENLLYRMVGQNSEANIARVLNGECDIVDQGANLNDQNELVLELEAAGLFEAAFVTGRVFEHADFGIRPICRDSGGWANCLVEGRPDFFGAVRMRRALAMCMDRRAVVDAVMFGQSIVLDSYVPPEHPLFNPEVARYPYDPAAGSALLMSLDWEPGGDGVRVYAGGDPHISRGARLSFKYSTTKATQRMEATAVLAESLAGCGVEVQLEHWNAGEYFADGPEGPLFGRRFDLGQFGWLTAPEPPCGYWLSEAIPGEESGQYPYGWSGWNNPGYASAAFDTACGAAMVLLPGEDGYTENHLEAQAIFAEDLPVVPLYLRLNLVGTRPDLCGLRIDSTTRTEFWNIEGIDYGPGCQDNG